MTKISVFGEETTKKELKKIEFVKGIYDGVISEWIGCEPRDWDYVTLIHKDEEWYDTMLVFDSPQSSFKHIVFGHWNDGVV